VNISCLIFTRDSYKISYPIRGFKSFNPPSTFAGFGISFFFYILYQFLLKLSIPLAQQHYTSFISKTAWSVWPPSFLNFTLSYLLLIFFDGKISSDQATIPYLLLLSWKTITTLLKSIFFTISWIQPPFLAFFSFS
jgi:hypothetical protein